jgi:Rnl2 family RNA ligase
MPIPKYPEVALLDKRPEIFSVKEVVATEKLHGSNFRIHFPLGMASLADVRYGSRDVEDTDPLFPLRKAKEWFESRPDLLTTMWEVIKSYGFSDCTIFGEAYGPGIKAKGVKYATDDDKNIRFRAFDIMVGERESFVTYDLFIEIADKMSLPRVHEVWRGEPTKATFDALLEQPSHEGKLSGIDDPNNHAEGVVIRSNPLLRNVFGEWLIVKHKAGKFAEKAEAPTIKLPREATPGDAFVATYVTEGRVTNAIGRLADRGTPLKGDMTDMPALLAEIIADLHKECEVEWKATGMPDGTLKGSVSKVLGPLYRQMLTKG